MEIDSGVGPICYFRNIDDGEKKRRQAVAELGQTQVKLEVIDEIVVEVRS